MVSWFVVGVVFEWLPRDGFEWHPLLAPVMLLWILDVEGLALIVDAAPRLVALLPRQVVLVDSLQLLDKWL